MDRLAKVNWGKSSEEGILSLIHQKGTTYSEITALYHWENHEWKNWTYEQITTRVKQLSDYLIEEGVRENDRIAILSESRPQWLVAFLAAVRCAAVVVPLDIKLTPAELSTILADCEPRLIFGSAALPHTADPLSN